MELSLCQVLDLVEEVHQRLVQELLGDSSEVLEACLPLPLDWEQAPLWGNKRKLIGWSSLETLRDILIV